MRSHPPIVSVATTVILLIGLVGLACAGDGSAPRQAQDSPVQGKAEPFAVIELFTSEGCSSCPPADRALSDLVREVRADGRRVFPLAFHVDYWDRLGWADPFADRAFSDRQRAYATRFKADGIYTPQAIVNGRVEFVGSDRERVDREVKAALEAPVAVAIAIAAKAPDARNVVGIGYAVTGTAVKATLNVALVERTLETKVSRGENAGRTLPHDNVVRAFQVIPLDKPEGRVEIKLPADAVVKNVSVVAYVQDADMKTLSATATDLAAADKGPGNQK